MAKKQKIKDQKFDMPESSISTYENHFRNLAVDISSDQLERIATQVSDGYLQDVESRSDWMDDYVEWKKALVVKPEVKEKQFPWAGAANIVLPVTAIANCQFSARMSDAMFNTKQLVRAMPTNPKNNQKGLCDRVQTYMNYQLTDEQEYFTDGFEQTMHALGACGVAVRKVCHNDANNRNESIALDHENFVVNYYTKNMETCRRATHVINMDYDSFYRYMDSDIFLNIDIIESDSVNMPEEEEYTESTNELLGVFEPAINTDRIVLEQHTWIKFNENDKKMHPVIVWLDVQTKKVVRIMTRVHPETRETMSFFVEYFLLPNIDSSFYRVGFGTLLQATNKTQNTIINQLIDAGVLNNTSGGFIKKGTGIKRGDVQFKMGQYKEINVKLGARLSDMIMPLNFKEPSQVLLALLNVLQGYADRVTSVTETQTGDIPRSGTGSEGVIRMMEQGLKLFTSIQKRVHRSFKKELNKLYMLNGIWLEESKYFYITDVSGDPMQKTISRQDFNSGLLIQPVSDPNMMNKIEKQQRAAARYQTVMSNPYTNQNIEMVYPALRNYLEAIIEDEQELELQLAPLAEMYKLAKLQRLAQQEGMENQLIQVIGTMMQMRNQSFLPSL